MLFRISAGLALALIVVLMLWPSPAPISHSYFDAATTGRTEVIAHGGGLGLRPANTIAALDAAVEMGADILEVDVQRTADGVLVLLHDDTLDRTTDLSGAIAEMTWAEVQTADAGANRLIDGVDYSGDGIGVPRFDDALARYSQMRWVAEIKPDTEEAARAMCHAITAARMTDKVLVGSFHKDALTHFRTACPNVATSMHGGEVARFAIAARLGVSRLIKTPAVAMQVPIQSSGIRLAHPRILHAAQERGIRVQFWTINDPDEMEMLIDLGADGIITDYVPRLTAILGEQTTD